MKNHPFFRRSPLLSLLFAGIGSSVSCMTTYDNYGRPVQSVDPGLAIAGVAVAGLVGYAAAGSRNSESHHRYETYDRDCDDGYYSSGCYTDYVPCY